MKIPAGISGQFFFYSEVEDLGCVQAALRDVGDKRAPSPFSPP